MPAHVGHSNWAAIKFWIASNGLSALMISCLDIKTKKVKAYNYQEGKMFDSLQALDEYIRQSALKVADT